MHLREAQEHRWYSYALPAWKYVRFYIALWQRPGPPIDLGNCHKSLRRLHT